MKTKEIFDKKRAEILCLILVSLMINLLISCSKERQEITGNTWKVESIRLHPDSSLNHPKDGLRYILTFDNRDYSFEYTHDVAGYRLISQGKARFKLNNSIKFKDKIKNRTGVIICYSKFCKNIRIIFEQIKNYNIKGNKLVLSDSDGKIINFKKI